MMKILFIGGCANGRFIDVTPVEFENPNDPEDYHWAYPDLFNVPVPAPRNVTRWAEGESPAPSSVGYQQYMLNDGFGNRGNRIVFYSLQGMTRLEVDTVFSRYCQSDKGRAWWSSF
ncbi:hypothetical protein VPHPG9A1_0023 [Vibrio phage PG9A-1]